MVLGGEKNSGRRRALKVFSIENVGIVFGRVELLKSVNDCVINKKFRFINNGELSRMFWFFRKLSFNMFISKCNGEFLYLLLPFKINSVLEEDISIGNDPGLVGIERTLVRLRKQIRDRL